MPLDRILDKKLITFVIGFHDPLRSRRKSVRDRRYLIEEIMPRELNDKKYRESIKYCMASVFRASPISHLAAL